jgi:hypothetical protein
VPNSVSAGLGFVVGTEIPRSRTVSPQAIQLQPSESLRILGRMVGDLAANCQISVGHCYLHSLPIMQQLSERNASPARKRVIGSKLSKLARVIGVGPMG